MSCAVPTCGRPARDQFPAFDALSRGITFQRGIGLPGRVWASGQPAWIDDVVHDGNFPRAAVAAREGLHAALGFPVTLRGEVVSVIEFFSREILEPDARLLATLTTIGRQIGMFIDRRRAQEELDRFFTLSLDLLCVAGFDGYFKRVNPAWQKTLGYTEAELLSRPYVEFVHPEDRVATTHESDRLSAGGELLYFENRYLHKDGTLRWLLWASTPYPELQVVYATAHDITERKAAEETMAQLRARPAADASRARRSGVTPGTTRQRAGGRQAAGRGRHRGEERLPRQHEPRDPHAAQRHSRHGGAGAADAPHRRTARVPRHHQVVRRGAARGHQRHSRLLEDRSAAARPRARSRSTCARRWAMR